MPGQGTGAGVEPALRGLDAGFPSGMTGPRGQRFADARITLVEGSGPGSRSTTPAWAAVTPDGNPGSRPRRVNLRQAPVRKCCSQLRQFRLMGQTNQSLAEKRDMHTEVMPS
jgi:hypothetical protein